MTSRRDRVAARWWARLIGPHLVMILVVALTCGCSVLKSEGPDIEGTWGLAAQSGEVVPVLRFDANGTYEVFPGSGSGLAVGLGRYVVIDERTVRTAPGGDGNGAEVEFRLEDDGLCVRSKTLEMRGYSRLP